MVKNFFIFLTALMVRAQMEEISDVILRFLFLPGFEGLFPVSVCFLLAKLFRFGKRGILGARCGWGRKDTDRCVG